MIDPFEPHDAGHGDYFSATSVTLGELCEMGFYNPDDDSWKWAAPSDEIYSRVCEKFKNRYWYRELGTFPAFRWKQAYLEKFAEIMPKYARLYELLADGFDIVQDSDEYGKRRDVFSEFPATLLTGNADYTSTGTDSEWETVKDGNALDKYLQFVRDFKDVDVLVLDECEGLFSCLLTSTVPLF